MRGPGTAAVALPFEPTLRIGFSGMGTWAGVSANVKIPGSLEDYHGRIDRISYEKSAGERTMSKGRCILKSPVSLQYPCRFRPRVRVSMGETVHRKWEHLRIAAVAPPFESNTRIGPSGIEGRCISKRKDIPEVWKTITNESIEKQVKRTRVKHSECLPKSNAPAFATSQTQRVLAAASQAQRRLQ